jgi:hypothetical protein
MQTAEKYFWGRFSPDGGQRGCSLTVGCWEFNLRARVGLAIHGRVLAKQ